MSLRNVDKEYIGGNSVNTSSYFSALLTFVGINATVNATFNKVKNNYIDFATSNWYSINYYSSIINITKWIFRNC